jgi:hypothetical protein
MANDPSTPTPARSSVVWPEWPLEWPSERDGERLKMAGSCLPLTSDMGAAAVRRGRDLTTFICGNAALWTSLTSAGFFHSTRQS